MIRILRNPHDPMTITSSYAAARDGGSRKHRGIDIAPVQRNVDGDPIYSVNEGIVRYAQYKSSYGNVVVVEHPGDGFCSLYAHLSKIYASVGQRVGAGTVLGAMGTTGNSTGTHLHFEVHDTTYANFWSYNYVKNPAAYLGNAATSTSTQLDSTTYVSQQQPVDYTRNTPDLDTVRNDDVLYGRRYQLVVSDTEGQGFDLSALRVVFSVKKTILLETNFSVIRVYNLNTTTENAIIQAGIRVQLSAGYEGSNFGLIFDGDITQVLRGKENATDYYIDIIAIDSERFLNSGFVNFSILRGQTQRTVIDQVTTSASSPAQLGSISTAYNNQELIRGKVVFGKAKDYLYQISKSAGTQFYMEDGKVNMIRAEDLPQGEILRLTYESGLVNIPQQTEQGVNIQALLNPRLKCNTLISIDNSNIVENQVDIGSLQRLLDRDGVYRIMTVSYIGDTRGQEWYANMETVTQAGYLPAVLASIDSNLFY